MIAYRTQNGKTYRVIIRGAWNRIYAITRTGDTYKRRFIGSVPRGTHGDQELAPCPNRDAHRQIRARIEKDARSPLA